MVYDNEICCCAYKLHSAAEVGEEKLLYKLMIALCRIQTIQCE